MIFSAPSLLPANEAGGERRPPHSPASMLAHWTIGSPSERQLLADAEYGFASEPAVDYGRSGAPGRS
jgi:hypothetical protein